MEKTFIFQKMKDRTLKYVLSYSEQVPRCNKRSIISYRFTKVHLKPRNRTDGFVFHFFKSKRRCIKMWLVILQFCSFVVLSGFFNNRNMYDVFNINTPLTSFVTVCRETSFQALLLHGFVVSRSVQQTTNVGHWTCARPAMFLVSMTVRYRTATTLGTAQEWSQLRIQNVSTLKRSVQCFFH